MDTTDPLVAHIPAPTAARPLLGLTVLVVEDSRFACEAIRLLCLRSGARIRRADCLRSARRHLRVYRPAVVMIDLGLPDGNGLDLIAELAATQPRVEVIMGMSADDHLSADAIAAGADSFIPKPILSLATFQTNVLALLPEGRRPKGPRLLDETIINPDRIAYRDDIAHIADVLDESDDNHTLDYVAQFLTGVARSADDAGLEQAAVELAKRRALGQPAASETAVLAGMIQQRLAEKIAI